MTSRFRFEGFELDLTERVLLSAGSPVRLSSRQFDLLAALVAQQGAVVSKDELLNRVWPGQAVEENNAAVHVSALRRVLGREAIDTVAGQGYRFAWPLQRVGASPSVESPPPLIERTATLPSPPPVFIGREGDLRALSLRSAQHRLVTVVGAPGLGKSALALACAHQRKGAFADGVLWVDLLREDSAPPQSPLAAVATALGLAADTPLPALLATLRPLDLLLVLDNVEIAVQDAAALCLAIVEGTERVSLLVTSRQVLRVAGERLHRLAPLSVPAGACDAATAMTHGAVALFVDQARAQDRGFTLGAHNVDQVIALCRRLDGLPLALQLAAGRLTLFGLDQLCERLDDRFRLLTRATEAGPRRHRSLLASMDASHDLLSDTERLVLRRLQAFEGGFTLDMVVADCLLDAWTLADALQGLVDQSLVVVDTEERPRYHLLDCVRAYGQLLLEEAGETTAAHRQHAHTIARLFERAARARQLMPDHRWLTEFGPELANLRAALDWCLVHEPVTGVKLLVDAIELFELLGLRDEAQWRMAAFVPYLPADLPAGLLGSFCLAHAILLTGADPTRASAWFVRGVAACRTDGDAALVASALSRQATMDRSLTPSMLRALMSELAAGAEERPARERLWELAARARLASVEGDAAGALVHIQASLKLAEEIGACRWLLDDLRRLLALQLSQARPLPVAPLVRSLADAGPRSQRQLALGCLAIAELADGRVRDARETLADLVALRREGGDDAFTRLLPVFAWLALEEGRHGDAARLIGHAGRFSQGDEPVQALWRPLMLKLRSQLDTARFAQLQQEGAGWDGQDALSVALTLVPERDGPMPALRSG